MEMNRDDFINFFCDVLDKYNKDIIQKYENDIAKAYVNVGNLPSSIFESGLEECIDSRSSLMRIFADSLQVKYLYKQLVIALAEELHMAGYIK